MDRAKLLETVPINQNPDDNDLDFEADAEYSANDYRACAIMFLSILQPAIAHVLAAKNQKIGYCQLMFALGLEDGSMRDAAAKLCVDVKCISDGARKFVKENGLSIPACMKSEAASKSYSKSRKERLTA